MHCSFDNFLQEAHLVLYIYSFREDVATPIEQTLLRLDAPAGTQAPSDGQFEEAKGDDGESRRRDPPG